MKTNFGETEKPSVQNTGIPLVRNSLFLKIHTFLLGTDGWANSFESVTDDRAFPSEFGDLNTQGKTF